MTDQGCAAEESGGGKAILLQRGGYKKMDICIMYIFLLTAALIPDRRDLQVTPGSNATKNSSHWNLLSQTRSHRQVPGTRVRYFPPPRHYIFDSLT